jgi:hypothetical protein
MHENNTVTGLRRVRLDPCDSEKLTEKYGFGKGGLGLATFIEMGAKLFGSHDDTEKAEFIKYVEAAGIVYKALDSTSSQETQSPVN